MKMQAMTYSRGATINQGNFNSVRFDISVTVALDDGDDQAASYEKAKAWVGKCLAAEVKSLNGAA